MDYQWEEVEGEASGNFVKFSEIGQKMIGIFDGLVDRMNRFDKPETVLNFRGLDGAEGFSISAPADLKGKAKKLTPGNIVRITYVEDRDVGKDSPMKVFKVEQAPAPKAADVPF